MTCDDLRVHAPAGSACVPADAALWRPPAARSNSAWLICERPALCRQTKRTCAIAPTLCIDICRFNR